MYNSNVIFTRMDNNYILHFIFEAPDLRQENVLFRRIVFSECSK